MNWSVQGKESDTFEKAASAILAVQLDGQVGGAAKQVSYCVKFQFEPTGKNCINLLWIKTSKIVSSLPFFLNNEKCTIIFSIHECELNSQSF